MKKIFIASLLLITSVMASANGLDFSTHNTLIQKLEDSVKDISDKETQSKINLRLADLYSDKARILDLNNMSAAAKTDREKAVTYYLKSYKSHNDEDSSRILLQLSHLYTLLGQSSKAEKIFKNIIADRKNRNKQLVGEAYAGLGEIEFKRGDFKNAGENFKLALQHPISKPVEVLQRLAWCEFNAGHFVTSQKLIISALSKNDVSEVQKKDLSRDLTTFMAKGSLTEAKIQELMKLSPADSQKSNLFYLGQEADRLGNHSGSVLVWAHVAKLDNVSDEEKAEMTLRQAQSEINEAKFKSGIAHYEQYFKQFNSLNCKKLQDVCDDLKARSRNLVHSWIRKEKTRPSIELRTALIIYTDNNSDDIEMLRWTGNIARFQKDFKTAVTKYKQAASVAKEKEKNELLVTLIETAEEANQIDLQRDAYNTYLSMNPNGPKASEVKYQLAYLLYREKKYDEASVAFHRIATDKTGNQKLKEQAADLSLDALAIKDNRSQIEKYAIEYSKEFKSQKTKFLTLARKAIVNESVAQYKAANGSDSKIRAALEKIKTAPLAGANSTEILELQKSRAQMAAEIRDLDETDAAAIAILGNKSLNSKDKEEALAQRLWVAESQLKFVTAYKIAQSMSFPQLDRASRHLKMGILADLAGKSPVDHYKNYIKYVSSRRSANVIRVELIKRSSKPWNEFRNFQRALSSTPDLYTQALVECYGQSPKLSLLKKYAVNSKLRTSEGAAALRYQIELDSFDMQKSKFKGLKLNSKTDKQLATSLNHRLNLLTQLEKYTQKTLNNGHLGIQIRSLDLLSREYSKLYFQILGLPVPKGLKVAQRKEYKDLLQAKALPFKQKSDQIKSQSEELWKSNKQLEAMLASLDDVSSGARTLLIRDLNTIRPYAPKSVANSIDSKIKVSRNSDYKQLVADIEKLKRSPFDTGLMEKIKQVQIKRGKTAMVAFLDSRQDALKKGKM